MTSKTSTNCVGRAVTTAVTGDLVTSWGNRRRLASILRRAFRIVGMGKQRAIGKLAGAGVIGMTSIAIATSGGSASAQVFQSDNSAAAAPPVASGANSSAGGYGASATGAGSTVVGNSATDNGNGGAVAIGNNAAVTNGNAIAIGSSAAAAGNHSVALGSNTSAQGTEDIAIGYLAAAATGTQSVAIGSHASAADQATALGNDVKASGSSSVAIGGDDLNEVALTHGAIYTSLTGSTLTANTYISTQASDGSTAVGVQSTANGFFATAVGLKAAASGAGSFALGTAAKASGQGAGALGLAASSTGLDSLAAGTDTSATAAYATALGSGGNSVATATQATGAGALALGGNATAGAKAIGADALALGGQSVATNAGDVALGQGSTTATAVRTAGTTLAGTAYTFAGTTPASTVSVGAPGAERTITNVAAGRLSPTSTDAVNGSELYATNAAVGSLASGGAGPVQYSNAATPTTPNGGVPSQNLTLVGAAAGPVTLDNVAPGALTAASTQAVNGGQINTIGTSVATNFGGGSTFDPTTGTVTAPTYNVAGGTQTNVGAALGALDTAAQMQGAGLAAALGGGAAVAPNGTVTAPAYTLNGTTYTNVGTALGGIANGAVGPVEYSNAATPTTPNGGVPSQNLTLVGAAAGPVTLDNVAPGALTAASTQAVNGGQINTLGSSEAANLGGGSTFNPATGTVTAPTYNVAGTAYTNVGSAITALTGGSTTAGVKYFHANSTGPDSTATGADSIAVGSGTTATGQYAIAQGFGASAGSGTDMSFRSSGGIAIGAFALAGNNPGGTSLAIGDRASATSATGDAVAIGTNTTANAVDSIAIGAQTTASAMNTIAIGNNGTSNAGTNSVVIGVASMASTAASGSVVVGSNSSASAANETVLGRGASATTAGGVALGNGSLQLRGGLAGGTESFSGTAVASTNGAVSVGAAGAERQITNVAGGTQATDAVNVRQLTAVGADLAGSLGGGATFNPATGAYTAPAYTLNGTTYTNVGTALGGVANGAVGPVEYSNAATPTTPNGGVPSQNLTLVGAAAGPVTLDNVAPGALTAASTQAVNGAQINTLGSSEATNLGGGSTFNPATGTVTAPTYNVAGGTQANVGAALGALDTATQTQGAGLAMALGGGAAVAPNGTVTAPAYTLNGTTYTNVGTALGGIANGAVGPVEYANAATPTTPNGGVPSQNLTLVGAAAGPVTLDNVAPGALTAASTQAVNGGQINTLGSSVATNFGGGSTFDPATGTVTSPTYNVAGTAYDNVGSAIGALTGGSTTAGVKYFHANSTGADSSATGVDSVAIGSGAVATNAGDVALGQGSTTATAVHTAGTTIAGTAYTFAGTTPASTVSVGAPGAERTITNVAAGQVTATSTDAVNGSELYATNTALGSLASGGAGPVQYANAATPTTPDCGVPSQNLTLVGAAAGPVTLDNVAPGALTTGSTQAVNGGQINTLGTSEATNFGGGSTFDPTTGTVTAPTYNVAGGTQTNVGAALGALDAATQMQGLGLAMALGGGASVAPNGTVTAPAYTLNGTTYTNVGAALGGIANGAVGPVQYANAATPTTPNGGVPSQNLTLVGAAAGPVTLDNVAPGALTATSTQAVNGSQLYATNNNVAALTNGTAGLVQQTGGSPGNGAITIGSATGGATLDVSGTAGNRVVTGVQAGAVNAGSSDAVNGSQLYASSASVAAALGGGSVVAANGTVTAPSYTVQGGTYNNVGGAIGAIDGDLSTLSTAVGGGGIKYFHANSPGGADSQAIGTDSVAIGSGAIANNPGDIALGQGSTTAAAVATTGTTIAGTAYTFAGTTPTSTLSVGAPGAERTITNVAAGQLTATSTDAVNGSELYATNQAVTAVGKSTNQLGASTADALGGGATYDPATGKLVAPTYNVGATAYNNVGGAVGALQTGAPLQYSTAAAPTTGNGYVASQDATLVGAANGPVVLHNVGAGVAASDAANVGQLPGAFTAAHSNTFAFAQNGSGGAPVTLTNVAAGAISAKSTQAVNGSQLYNLAQGTSSSINNLTQAFGGLENQVAANDRRASAGTAIALAATGLRYDDRAGKISLGAGTSVFRGEVGFAAGIGGTSDNNAWRYNASVSFAPTEAKSDIGAVVGATYTLN